MQVRRHVGSVTQRSLGASHGDGIWLSLQNLLTAAANVSKALWGTDDKIEAARLPLRESLAVADGSALNSRKLRNHFDHFDERLDEWWTKSGDHNLVDCIVGPPGAIVFEGGLTEGVGSDGSTPLRQPPTSGPTPMTSKPW